MVFFFFELLVVWCISIGCDAQNLGVNHAMLKCILLFSYFFSAILNKLLFLYKLLLIKAMNPLSPMRFLKFIELLEVLWGGCWAQLVCLLLVKQRCGSFNLCFFYIFFGSQFFIWNLCSSFLGNSWCWNHRSILNFNYSSTPSLM